MKPGTTHTFRPLQCHHSFLHCSRVLFSCLYPYSTDGRSPFHSPPSNSPTPLPSTTHLYLGFPSSIPPKLLHHSRGKMPSCTPDRSSTSSSSTPKRDLAALLDTARPFLCCELESVDPESPALLATLRAAGAGECWHKHGSFLDHLADTHRILHLWGAQPAVSRCGLYHSAYSNSYVNLAIFDPSTSRDAVRRLIGPAAERLVHLFCVVPRQPLIHDDLLFRYPSDAELRDHLEASEASLHAAKEKGFFDANEPWRHKLNSVLPANGIVVKHIKTGEDLPISRRLVAAFLLMTMADFSDQLFGFQDMLFENHDGRLEFKGNNCTTLWPGDGKPGLWMNSISRMGALYALIVREEEIYLEERNRGNVSECLSSERDEEIELVVPPVFDYCTKVLDAREQIEARDLYWEAVCGGGGKEVGGLERTERLLRECCEKNPFVGEPRLVLAQVYVGLKRYEKAEEEAEKGLSLMLEWGSCWDKRMSWHAWIAWGRVLLMKAKERSWPEFSWGIINLGLVKSG